MYAVGVGKAVEEELREIASEPSELHVSYSPDFSTMTHLLENLKGSICPGEWITSGLLEWGLLSFYLASDRCPGPQLFTILQPSTQSLLFKTQSRSVTLR